MTLADAQALVEACNGRLSGSRAYGQPRVDSDWDYYMVERQVKKLAKVLDARGVKWDSPFLGSLSFWTSDGWLIEVSYLFPRTAAEHRRQARWPKKVMEG